MKSIWEHIEWIAVAILVVVLLGGFLFKVFAHLWFKAAEKVENLINLPPYRIRLAALRDPEWMNSEPVQSLAGPLRAAGFQDVGVYEIESIPGTKIFGLVHPGTSVMAAICQLGKVMFLDLVSRFEDGSSLTLCNVALGQEFERPPHLQSRRMPGASSAQLYEAMLKERPAKPLRPASARTFSNDYEDGYAVVQTWNAERGGPTAEEIRNVIIGLGKEPTPVSVSEFRNRYVDISLKRWWTSLPNPPVPANEAEEVLVVIHDEMTPELLAYRFSEWTGNWEIEEKDFPAGLSARAAFAALNAREGDPFLKVYEKKTPLEADFYIARQIEGDES
ncbi:MAG: hypothetical protein AB1705_12595 [Verrucomicrobiota bacterium]